MKVEHSQQTFNICTNFKYLYSVNNIVTLHQSIVTAVLKIEPINELFLHLVFELFWAILLDQIDTSSRLNRAGQFGF